MPDFLPLWLIGVVFVLASLVAYEVGFRVGRWWQRRTPGEQEGPTGVLVGSLLALLAFMLAIATGMAADRFDARRGFVMEQANAIRVAYLQAGYLPAPENDQIQQLLREYAPLQIRSGSIVVLGDLMIGEDARSGVPRWAAPPHAVPVATVIPWFEKQGAALVRIDPPPSHFAGTGLLYALSSTPPAPTQTDRPASVS